MNTFGLKVFWFSCMGKKVPFLARAIFKVLFNLGSYNFLAYLECIRSYAWSKGHSKPGLSSVYLL